MRLARRGFCAALLASASAAVVSARAFGQPFGGQAERTGTLLAGVERVEGVRAVKRLHDSWAEYAIFGLWDAISDLFAEDGEMLLGNELVRGRASIAQHLRTSIGGGTEGRRPGALHSQLLMTPVVTLSPDGARARGRWHEIAMIGSLGGEARWAGGILENEYVKRNGTWQIARLHYTPQFAGGYAEGWSNVAEDLGIVPYHYTPDEAGTPASTLPFPARPATNPTQVLAEAERRIATLEDEDAVRNLQFAYGYYVDRKMWDDVVDLFAPGSSLEIDGLGNWTGAASIRRALERNGPAGLRHGELNDHVQVNPIVEVSPDGTEAWARGIELGMIGRNNEFGLWTVATFENRFMKQEGVWMLTRMRISPIVRTDYYQGWARDQSPEPLPAPEFAPDVPAEPLQDTSVPMRVFDHPVTGRPVRLPSRLLPEIERLTTAQGTQSAESLADRIAGAEAGLRRAAGFDAIENISNALGNWLDDLQSAELAALFSAHGERKSPAAGYYIGPDRIRRMQELRNGSLRRPRTSLPMHLRVQPIIHTAPDGLTAKLRTRLLQFNSRWGGSGSLTGGMYEDTAVLENGVWKFQSNVINHIWRTPGYKAGWARVPEGAGETLAPSPTRLLQAMPPDRPLDGPAFAPFPAIGPLEFHYRNPVSGRAPSALESRDANSQVQ